MIRKPEILVTAILSLENNERGDIALGLATVLANLSEINDEKTLAKLQLLKADCYKGLSLDECLELYSMYKNVNPFVSIFIDGLNIKFRLLDLKGAFRDMYYKILDYILNIDFSGEYGIGVTDEEEQKIYAKIQRGLSGQSH